MVRIVAQQQPPQNLPSLGFPTLRGETEIGGKLRQGAFQRSAGDVEAASKAVVASLCRRTWEQVVGWMWASPASDPEAPMRVAVVRAGFCEGTRDWATRRAAEACAAMGASVVALKSDFIDRMADEAGRASTTKVVVVVEDAERCEPWRLCELLTTAADARCAGIALLAASHWSVPSTLPTRISSRVFARDFAMPPFDAFANALLVQLVASTDASPICFGPRAVGHWLETSYRHRDARGLVSQVKYALFVHFFTQPHAFVALADSIEVAAAEIDADVETLSACLAYRQIARLAVALAEAAIRVAHSSDSSAAWTAAVGCLQDPAESAVAVARAFRVGSPRAILGRWREIFRRIVDLEGLGASCFAARHATALRLAAARLVQLYGVATAADDDGPRRRQLAAASVELYEALAHQAAKLPTFDLAPLVYFDDAPAVALPFGGSMWSAAIQALDTSFADVRCLAFQVLRAECSCDLPTWYKLLQRKKAATIHDDPDHDDKDRACEFVRVVLSSSSSRRSRARVRAFLCAGLRCPRPLPRRPRPRPHQTRQVHGLQRLGHAVAA